MGKRNGRGIAGFIFEKNDKYYFILSTRKNRNKADAQIIMDFFVSRLANQGKYFTIDVLRKTHELIQKEMYWAEIKQSDDFEFWFIHTKNMGATIKFDDLVYIEK